jgi:hypothetical protein
MDDNKDEIQRETDHSGYEDEEDSLQIYNMKQETPLQKTYTMTLRELLHRRKKYFQRTKANELAESETSGQHQIHK